MLTLVEMSRFKRELQRQETHNLAKNLTTYFTGENKNETISQEHLIELVHNGSLDSTQAFLIFNLFHERSVNNKLAQSPWSQENATKLFGMFQLGDTIHAILIILFILIFMTQTCIEKDGSTIVFQLCTAALTLNLSADASDQGMVVSATVYHWVHDITVFFITTNCLVALGFTECRSLFNLFKEKKRTQKSPKMDIMLNCLFVGISYLNSASFPEPTCQLFLGLYLGYLLFRLHNYLHNFVLSDIVKPFPLVNLNSSATAVLLVVGWAEFQTVTLFLSTSMQPHEIPNSSYLLPIFTMIVAQFLNLNFTFTYGNMFAEQIYNYQVALSKNYPKGLRSHGESFLFWSFFTCLGLLMMGIGFSLQVNCELIFAGLLILLETNSEWYQYGPSWFRRRMVMMDFVVSLCCDDVEQEEGAETGKRMTLKEFMMSDSQRAQVEYIDWDKDITEGEKLMTACHYGIKIAIVTIYMCAAVLFNDGSLKASLQSI